MDGNNVPDSKVLDTQEFFENQSQVNAQNSSLNSKRTFDEFQNVTLTAAQRSQVNFDNLQQVSLRALNNSVDLQAQINQRMLAGMDQVTVELETLRKQRARFADDANYVTRYDLSNPVTTASGDALRSAAYPANRGIDVASQGIANSAEAIAAAVAKAINDSLTAELATLTATVATLANIVKASAGGGSSPTS